MLWPTELRRHMHNPTENASNRVMTNWLRGRDLNPRPPGYEPDELPAALPRDVFGAEDRNRTGTVFKDRRILSPVRLPVPPLRLNCSISIPCFNGKYYYIVFNFKRQYLIISNVIIV